MSDAAAAASKDSKFCVEFKYGAVAAPSYARYTDFTSDVVFGGGTFVSTPSMDVTLPAYSGGLSERRGEIVLPRDAFLDSLTAGEPVSRVGCTITEIFRATPSEPQVTRFRFVGEATLATRNFEGRRGIVCVEIESWKSRLEVQLGMIASGDCQNPFTGRGCFKSAVGLTENGTLGSIQQGEVSITGLAAHAGKYWHLGYVTRNGVYLKIRDWDSVDPTRFILVREPPASWAGQTVQVFPGCDRLKTTCKDRQNNEEHFNGFGIKMMQYNPLQDLPT